MEQAANVGFLRIHVVESESCALIAQAADMCSVRLYVHLDSKELCHSKGHASELIAALHSIYSAPAHPAHDIRVITDRSSADLATSQADTLFSLPPTQLSSRPFDHGPGVQASIAIRHRMD